MSEESLRSEPWTLLASKAGDGISITSHCSALAPAFCYESLSGNTRNLSTEANIISLEFIHNLFFFCVFPSLLFQIGSDQQERGLLHPSNWVLSMDSWIVFFFFFIMYFFLAHGRAWVSFDRRVLWQKNNTGCREMSRPLLSDFRAEPDVLWMMLCL